MTTFPSSPIDGTQTDDGRFVYRDPPGAWKRVGSTLSTDIDSLRNQLADKADRTDLDEIELRLPSGDDEVVDDPRAKAQSLSAVSGVTTIDLLNGLYVKVTSTSGAWQPEFVNWPDGGAEVILSVDTSGTHEMTSPAGTDWDSSDTAPVTGDWVADTRMVMRFTRMPFDEGLIGELLRDIDVPDANPDVTLPTITGWYSTSSDLSSPTALDGATLPTGDVYVWFGPNTTDIAEMQIFFNAGTLPAIGSESTDETFVRSVTTHPFHLMPGSSPGVPVAWDQLEDPTGNLLASYDDDGSNTIKVRAIAIDGDTSETTFTFNTTAPAAPGSTPTITSYQRLFTSGGANYSVTIPDGVDRTVVVQAIFRNGNDAAVTGMTLNGTPMTVGASQWVYTNQFFGSIVCTLNESDLSTGTATIIPTWEAPGPGSASLIAYRVDVLTNVDSPAWTHDIDYQNGNIDRAPSLSANANSFLITSAAEQYDAGYPDQALSGITPTGIQTQENGLSSWLNMVFRSAFLDDSGAAGTETATWSNSSRGVAILSSLSYSASAGGGGGTAPIIPAKVALVTLDNGVGDYNLFINWSNTTGAEYYQVKWGQSSPPARTPVSVVNDFGYTATGLAGGDTTYYVQVRGVSTTGDTGEWSDVVSATVPGDVGTGGGGGSPTTKFLTSTDPYDVSMSEGMGAMRYPDLWVPTAWRRVNAVGSSYAKQEEIIKASAIWSDLFIGRWQGARKTPFQVEAGPRLFVTLHMGPGNRGFTYGTVDSWVQNVLNTAKSGSTGSLNSDSTWRTIAADVNRTVNVGGQTWNLRDHIHLSISHEQSGGWSGSYWGYVPQLQGNPAFANPSAALYGQKMREALLHVYNTGLLTKVHARCYEHISDIFDDEDPRIIRGMSPALSNSSVPWDAGENGSALTNTWYSEALPDYGVDFIYPTMYWRKGGLRYTGTGSTTDPLNYTDNMSFGSFAIDIANNYGAAYGNMEFGGEYALPPSKNPGDASAPTDLEFSMGLKRMYNTEFATATAGLGQVAHWFFYSYSTDSRPTSGNSFHPLEGVWGQIASPNKFSSTGRPTSGMVNQSNVPASNTRYPLVMDWYRDEFPTSRLA